MKGYQMLVSVAPALAVQCLTSKGAAYSSHQRGLHFKAWVSQKTFWRILLC